MIKFEKHEGQLFRMLESPVPLTPDAEMPCLVRLIQDDSPMGKYNNDLHGFDSERLKPKICTEVIDVNDLSDHNRGSVRYDGFISCQYYHYELIGTFVEEGSDAWALYHAINGETVTMDDCGIYKIQDGKLWECFPNDSNEWRVVADDGYGYWLEYIHDNTGWQIYEEPKPAPQYKIGDWVEVECQNKIYHKQVLFVTEYRVGFEFNGTTPSVCFDGTPSHIFKFIRKLSPSEVVIPVNISGTVRQAYNEDGTINDEQFQLLPNGSLDGTEMFISFDAIDTQTRELVESLLKAMQGDE